MLELATAVVLLVGAGLLGKSLFRLLHVSIGFEPEHLVALQVGAPQSTYAKDEQVIALERELVRQVASLPGVTIGRPLQQSPGDAATATRPGSACWAGPGTENTMKYRSGM